MSYFEPQLRADLAVERDSGDLTLHRLLRALPIPNPSEAQRDSDRV